jgi:hypothetical protein
LVVEPNPGDGGRCGSDDSGERSHLQIAPTKKRSNIDPCSASQFLALFNHQIIPQSVLFTQKLFVALDPSKDDSLCSMKSTLIVLPWISGVPPLSITRDATCKSLKTSPTEWIIPD